MSTNSNIEWTDATWNPVRGCVKVSPGCANCYAETFAERFRGVKGHPYEQGFDLRLVPEKLMEPLKWKDPKRIFVNSMSDLFQDGVADQFIVDVFGVMTLAYWHTFQILTKRPERMLEFLAAGDHGIRRQFSHLQINGGTATREVFRALDRRRRKTENEWPWPLPNVWLGVSVENQHFADERIPLLLRTPAAVRFLSCEPLLEHITLKGSIESGLWDIANLGGIPPRPAIDWIIVGGESGHGSRPFDLAWARSIVQECKSAGVPCFVKQLGASPVIGRTAGDVFVPDHELIFKSAKGGDMAEWPADLQVREFPTVGGPQ